MDKKVWIISNEKGETIMKMDALGDIPSIEDLEIPYVSDNKIAIDMLKTLRDSVIDNRCTEKYSISILRQIKPSSFKFVMDEAIKALEEGDKE